MSANDTDEPPARFYALKFGVLIGLEIPSVIVSTLIFAYFGYYHRTRITEYNMSLLVLLAINFLQVITDLPMPINFFRLNGLVHPSTSAYCVWWTWYEFSLNTTNGFLMAWISIERHLLIFHSSFTHQVNTWKRRLAHIGPLVIFSLWGPVFYLFTIVISPMCTSEHYFDSLLCGIPCYLTTTWGTFDLFFDVVFPVLTIFIANLALFIRVVYQQTLIAGRMRNNWQRQRRMALQLGVISFVYLAVWIPLSIIQLGQIYIDPVFLLQQMDTFNYLVYIVPLILPMICLMSMPELLKTLKNLLRRRQLGTVMPLNETFTRQHPTLPISLGHPTLKP